MMNLTGIRPNRARLALTALGALLLQACSGPAATNAPTGTGTGATPIVLPGIEGSGIVSARVRGTIDRFGSVYVGGLRYSTGTAVLVGDAAAVDESQLRVGQIVTLDVRRAEDGSAAEALRVEQATAVVGCIDGVDAAARQLVVAGQTITTDAATLFGAGLERGFNGGFESGVAVAVSGLPDVGGALRATRIDARRHCEVVQVTGPARSIDPARSLLSVGAQRVDYSAVQVLDVDPGRLDAGSAIVVTGTLRDDVLVASTLRREAALVWEQGPVEIEALVTAIPSADAIELGSTRIGVGPGTRFEPGRPAVGEVVRIAARLVDGRLVAESVRLATPPLHRLYGSVTRLRADGSVEIGGFVVTIDARTRFHDPVDPRFSPAQLAAGQVVSVRGAPGRAPGVLHAAVIVRADASDDDEDDDDDDDDDGRTDDARGDVDAAAGDLIRIRSIVERAGDDGFQMLGRQIAIDGDTEFDDVSAQELSGQFVFVVARYRAGELVAREVQADGSDDLDD